MTDDKCPHLDKIRTAILLADNHEIHIDELILICRDCDQRLMGTGKYDLEIGI